MTDTTVSPWMNPHEAATYARRHYKTILTALQDCELRGHQSGARCRWSIHCDDVDKWLRGERPSRARKLRAA